MPVFFKRRTLLVMVSIIIISTLFVFSTHHKKIDYISEVKPILNKHCITCHGGVRRKAGFSLLFRSEALANTESGKPAIIPGDPDHSEMIRRLTLKDPEERMPFKHEPLSKKEIEVLRNWVKEGAQWGDHWAYLPVKPVEIPNSNKSFFGLFASDNAEWVKNDIDYFINDKLKEQKLSHAIVSDKQTLLRRVSLDLIGMPASEKLARQFLTDSTDSAYTILIDSLLASPHFGERWAAMWMDVARYADTKGYERDDNRNIWRYRDWLIKAFNEDKPYNQFLIEQIAGDMLPNPTDAQYIATAFHRNTMTNDEGGTDNEEFRTAAVIDRVNSTWEGLMGTTFACVQCHSHPYDPFTHDEYYKFLAFFNNSRDEDTEADYPLLRTFNDSIQLKLNTLQNWLKQHTTEEQTISIINFLKTLQPTYNSIKTDQFINCELSDTKWLMFRNNASARLPNISLDNKTALLFPYRAFVNDGTLKIYLDKPDGDLLMETKVSKLSKKIYNGSWLYASLPFKKIVTGKHDLYFSFTSPELKKPFDNGLQFDWFYFTREFPGKGEREYVEMEQLFYNLFASSAAGTTPVMIDNPKEMYRATHVFERGNWLVKGKEVFPETPHALNPLPAGAPHNRFGLAMWLTDKKNPLVSRTLVNRLWEQLFGTGLAETLEDLGTQGIPPTHRELLDHLAWQMMNDYKWSIKKLLKEMVLSATYMQDTKVTPELLEKDPANKYFSRGPRVRLSAEQIRDQCLVVSGLMNEKMYGPSVMPWQPEGIWLSPWAGQYWVNSSNGEQYRRAVYTFWKRTAPYPSMLMFDGAAREVCTARRIRTNTPLQALTTLNDSVYIDMARHFAYRMQKQGGNIQQQISRGYQLAMYKTMLPEKLEIMVNLYKKAFEQFKKDKQKTHQMVGGMDEHTNPETAALVVVANAMLNLDEFVTKN